MFSAIFFETFKLDLMHLVALRQNKQDRLASLDIFDLNFPPGNIFLRGRVVTSDTDHETVNTSVLIVPISA